MALVLALACGDGTGPRDTTSIAGQAIAADSASLVAMRVTLAAIGVGTSAIGSLDASGRFEVVAPREIIDAPSIAATIDAAAAAQRVFRPVLVSGSIDSVKQWLQRPLLVPRSMSMTGTSFGGSPKTVSLAGAFTLPCTDLRSPNCDSFFPQRWLTHVAVWPEADLPVALAFDHVTSVGVISDADSIALWKAIAKMHADLGRVVFRPATLGPGVKPDSAGYVAHYVTVRADSNLIGVGGYTNWIWDSHDDITAAAVVIPYASTAFAAPTVMPHELMHALGFTHTCAWSSVMGGYGCGFASSVTAGDAAAFRLAYAVRRAIVARSPTTNLGDARRGETQVEGLATVAATIVPIVRPPTPMGARIR